MKTKNKLYFLSIAVAVSLNSVTAQPFDSVGDLNNKAIAASPRAREQFPWITRSGGPRKAASIVPKSAALGASPRILEQYPELSRSVRPNREGQFASIINNRALASSPRAKEEFPWLLRGNYKVREEPFQIAPLK